MSSNSKPSPDIYSILCPSFHGATVFSVAMGNHSRILTTGDTIPEAKRGGCGCGLLRTKCPFWTALTEAWGPYDGRTIMPATPSLVPWGPANRVAAIGLSTLAVRLGLPMKIQPFERAVACYLSVCESQFDFDIYIDGYKSVSRYAAMKAAGYPVRGVIHILRDPRAVASSAKRRGREIEEVAAHWAKLHGTIRQVAGWMQERMLVVRYEDLCEDPAKELARVQDWLGVGTENLLVKPGPGRHWIGSRSVLNFDGRIEPARPWNEGLTPEEIKTVERITARQAATFGYAF